MAGILPVGAGRLAMREYIQLTKPRITWLILMSTAVGFYFGASVGWTWPAGTYDHRHGSDRIGTAALNQWWEREADARMARTKTRPLPLHLVSAKGAFWFSIALSVAGFLELWLGANRLTALLGLFTLAVICFSTHPEAADAALDNSRCVPGAMPPVIGYAAAAGTLDAQAWTLFAILFLWQFPHFYSIAWLYREDYSRAGIKMLPVVDPTGERTVRQIWSTQFFWFR